MINKKQAEDNSVNIIDSTTQAEADKMALVKKIKALLPSVINADNQLDLRALRDLLGAENTTSNNQGYELTFAGKGIARATKDTSTKLELQAVREQSKQFDTTGNILIRGDNLEVLKILYQNYHNKIKMIYIDPPYNTQSENFVYKDDFKTSDVELIERFGLNEDTSEFLQNVYGTRSHSGWLSFMYPRLKLARELLTDDGVIFISIDDNEQANLKILCDEIFGEENFVRTFTWIKRVKTSGVPTKNMILPNFEYVLCYKRKLEIKFLGQNRSLKSYKQNDDGQYWRIMPIQATGEQNNYFIITDPNTGIRYNGNWAFSEETIKEKIEKEEIIFPDSGVGKPNQIVYADIEKQVPIFAHLGLYDSEISTKAIKKLFNKSKVFDFPKPVNLISFLIEQILIDKEGIVLDFFAGSGTTGDAVMQLNAEDGGKRKFILAQWDEKIDEGKEAHKFCTDNELEPVIPSITIERLNRAGEKIMHEHTKKNGELLNESPPDIGYKVFKVTLKPRLEQEEGGIIQTTHRRANSEDTLVNMLAATGKPLDVPVETLQDGVLYKADGELYVLTNVDDEVLAQHPDTKINLDGWADINLQQYLNLDVVNNENINVIY